MRPFSTNATWPITGVGVLLQHMQDTCVLQFSFEQALTPSPNSNENCRATCRYKGPETDCSHTSSIASKLGSPKPDSGFLRQLLPKASCGPYLPKPSGRKISECAGDQATARADLGGWVGGVGAAVEDFELRLQAEGCPRNLEAPIGTADSQRLGGVTVCKGLRAPEGMCWVCTT